MGKGMRAKEWRPAPLVVVLATATLIIALLLGAGWFNARRYRVNARVEIAEPLSALTVTNQVAAAPQRSLPDGEVGRMAVRVREVSGLLYGLTLLAVTEQMNRRHVASVQALLQLLANRNLLPPGMQLQANAGALVSEHAALYVRYRPQPLGLEVVSVGQERMDGPRLMGRLTANSDDQTGALLLIAKPNTSETVPAPFAPLEQIVALGWQLEPLRERANMPDEQEQLRQWARQYASTGQ